MRDGYHPPVVRVMMLCHFPYITSGEIHMYFVDIIGRITSFSILAPPLEPFDLLSLLFLHVSLTSHPISSFPCALITSLLKLPIIIVSMENRPSHI